MKLLSTCTGYSLLLNHFNGAKSNLGQIHCNEQTYAESIAAPLLLASAARLNTKPIVQPDHLRPIVAFGCAAKSNATGRLRASRRTAANIVGSEEYNGNAAITPLQPDPLLVRRV